MVFCEVGGRGEGREGGKRWRTGKKGKRKGLDKSMRVVSLFIFLTCCRSLATLAMTLPYMAEFIVDSNLSLSCFLLSGVQVREKRERRMDEHRSRRIFFHRVGLVFFSLHARVSLSFSLSRAQTLSDRASTPCDPWRATLTRRREEKRENEFEEHAEGRGKGIDFFFSSSDDLEFFRTK